MDGWEFMQEFAKIKPRSGKKISVYMVSSSVDLNDIHRAKSISEVSDYLFKPVRINQLKEVVDGVIQNRSEQIFNYGA